MKPTSQKDFVSGIMFTAVGTAFAIGANSYTIGSAARMGPGYFPLLLGSMLIVLGLLIALQSFKSKATDGDRVGRFSWRPLGFIIGANLAFGVLLVGVPALNIPAFGMIIAIYALVLIAGYARPNSSLKESLVLGTILAAGSYFAFVYALNLQFPVWPAFATA